MKPAVAYTLAAVLLLATVPIYRSIWSRLEPQRLPASTAQTDADRPRPSKPSRNVISMTPNEAQAMRELQAGRAKCVHGVVYWTANHVIEPWPGGVRCVAGQDVAGKGEWVGVEMTGKGSSP